jgi:hypothetical protein
MGLNGVAGTGVVVCERGTATPQLKNTIKNKIRMDAGRRVKCPPVGVPHYYLRFLSVVGA